MKTLRMLCMLGIIGLAGLWYQQGMHLATLEERLVEKTVVDDFGDTVTQKEWVPAGEIGLDYLGPAAALLFVIAVGATIRLRMTRD